MTIVLARRFGELIELVSDTSISDSERGREYAIPGRLKIITLAANLTVAYAGHSDPALCTIRNIYRSGKNKLEEIIASLVACTASSEHDVEFLLVSHWPKADLRKIWCGRVSDSLQDAAIGNAEMRNAVYDRFKPSGIDQHDASNFYSAFLAAFDCDSVPRGKGVGGLPIGVKAYSEGHYYRFHSFHSDRKPIYFLPGIEQQQDPADMQTGDWTYHHAVFPPKKPGIAVLAAQVQQARRAYVYSPLLHDEASSIIILEEKLDWTGHQKAMNERTSQALESAIAEFRSSNPSR